MCVPGAGEGVGDGGGGEQGCEAPAWEVRRHVGAGAATEPGERE